MTGKVGAAKMRATTDELIGTVFGGRFNVIRLLGRGGMGAVYLVHHEVLQRDFALKVIHPTLVTDPEMEQMFRREARAASRVQHPNVTFVFDFAHSADGRPYIVMEYVEGVTLAREIALAKKAGKPFPLLRTIDVLAQVADALAAAHACGVIHRDLKPANVALTTRRGRDDFVKVLDFGLAKLLRGGTLNQVDSRSIFGTPEYMSPEQCLRLDEVDHRTDIYGLGIMAFEALTGEPPFLGEPLQVLYAHQEKEPPRPSQVRKEPDFPAQVDDLVLRCLRKEPAERPQSAVELASELRLLLASLRAGTGETMPPQSGEQPGGVFGAIPAAFARETGINPMTTGNAELLTKTLVSEMPATMAETISPGDDESHAIEDLVQALRDRDLASVNLVHLLSRMLEMDDALLEAELEHDLLQGQVVHLEMRTREREARLREALVQIEHESTRQASRAERGEEPEAAERTTQQIARLQQRAAELARRIRQVSEALDFRLGLLEKQLEEIEARMMGCRDDAFNLREALRRQLRGTREAALEADRSLEAHYRAAGL